MTFQLASAPSASCATRRADRSIVAAGSTQAVELIAAIHCSAAGASRVHSRGLNEASPESKRQLHRPHDDILQRSASRIITGCADHYVKRQ